MSRQSVPKLKRGLNPEKAPQVFLSLNEKHVELINRLLATGLWGNTANQVVIRLFDSACAAHLPPAPSPEAMEAIAKAREYADANSIDPKRVFAIPNKATAEWCYAVSE